MQPGVGLGLFAGGLSLSLGLGVGGFGVYSLTNLVGALAVPALLRGGGIAVHAESVTNCHDEIVGD